MRAHDLVVGLGLEVLEHQTGRDRVLAAVGGDLTPVVARKAVRVRVG